MKQTDGIMGKFNLSGKIALVTGASAGLGSGMAEGLAEAGADVVVVGRSEERLQNVRKAVEARGRAALALQCDVGDLQAVRDMFKTVVDRFGTVDILVNNAGITRRAPAVEYSDQDWMDVINTNLHAVFYCAREAGKIMLAQQHGKIINISSLLAFSGGITVPAYAAAKGGVAQLTKALANEWARHGINVNAIAPGYMRTPLTQPLQDDPVRNPQILDRIPAGDWGVPEDMKGAVVFLASEASRYIHGHVLVVDGGWMAR